MLKNLAARRAEEVRKKKNWGWTRWSLEVHPSDLNAPRRSALGHFLERAHQSTRTTLALTRLATVVAMPMGKKGVGFG